MSEHDTPNRLREIARTYCLKSRYTLEEVGAMADRWEQAEAEATALKRENEYLRGKAQAVVDGKTGGGFDKFSGFDDYIIPYQLVDELADALLGDQDA